jgi:hypothetical protein
MRTSGAQVTILHVTREGGAGDAAAENAPAGGARTLIDSVFSEDSGAVRLQVIAHRSPAEAALVESGRGHDLVIVGIGRDWGLGDRLLGIGFQPERLMSESPVSLLVGPRSPAAPPGARHAQRRRQKPARLRNTTLGAGSVRPRMRPGGEGRSAGRCRGASRRTWVAGAHLAQLGRSRIAQLGEQRHRAVLHRHRLAVHERHVEEDALVAGQRAVVAAVEPLEGELESARVAGEGGRLAAVHVAGELVEHEDLRQPPARLSQPVVELAPANRLVHAGEPGPDLLVEGEVLLPPASGVCGVCTAVLVE